LSVVQLQELPDVVFSDAALPVPRFRVSGLDLPLAWAIAKGLLAALADPRSKVR